MSTTVTKNEYTPAEALWAMYMSQSKSVRKAFRKRLKALDDEECSQKNMKEYAKALPREELEAVKNMVVSVKRSMSDVNSATAEVSSLCTPAEELLAELLELE